MNQTKQNTMIFEPKAAKAVAAFSLSDLHRTFLRDVDVFLDYLVKNPVPLSKNKNQPPVKWTQPLNSFLSTPEILTLKRPMTPHYAQVMGLLLLVRSSGLASFQANSRGSAELHINRTLYKQWQEMNEAERYFSLLESWINRGYAMSVGERISSMDDRFLPGFMMMFGDSDLWQGKAVVGQICYIAWISMPNSTLLINRPITISCICSNFEKHIVFLARRLI